MRGVASRTRAGEERLRRAMDGPRLLREALGLGPEYAQYFDELHDECMATACATDREFAQRLEAAGYRDATARVAADARAREARLDALWTQAASKTASSTSATPAALAPAKTSPSRA